VEKGGRISLQFFFLFFLLKKQFFDILWCEYTCWAGYSIRLWISFFFSLLTLARNKWYALFLKKNMECDRRFCQVGQKMSVLRFLVYSRLCQLEFVVWMERRWIYNLESKGFMISAEWVSLKGIICHLIGLPWAVARHMSKRLLRFCCIRTWERDNDVLCWIMPKKKEYTERTLLVYKYRPSGVPSFFLYSTCIPRYEI